VIDADTRTICTGGVRKHARLPNQRPEEEATLREKAIGVVSVIIFDGFVEVKPVTVDGYSRKVTRVSSDE
jgi:hypothetical protein